MCSKLVEALKGSKSEAKGEEEVKVAEDVAKGKTDEVTKSVL